MPASTSEIAKAIANFDAKTLKNTLKVFDAESIPEDKTALQKLYQDTVLKVGTQKFLSKLKEEDAKEACKALGLKDNSGAKELEEALNGSVDKLLAKSDDDLLKAFCNSLSLDIGEKTGMTKSIEDEVMLVGMERFLKKLDVPLLKSHCTELDLSSTGNKNQLVERLMSHIFELEPLENEKTKKSSKSKEKKEKKEPKSKSKKEGKKEEKSDKKEMKSPTKRSKSSSPARGRSSSPASSRSTSKTRVKSPAKTTKSKSPAAKKEKFVAPPLTTIKKGGYDNYTDLYDNFNLEDLVKYCRNNGMKVSGTKKEVIKRVIAYLDTGVVEENKPKKRKRTASASKKKDTKAAKTEEKAASPSKKTTKKAEDKKEEKETASKKKKESE